MSKEVYTYALVKALYDQGEDYIDSFWPFVVKVFPTDRTFINLNAIKTGVQEAFALEIPLHTLRTILSRAKRKGHIEREREQCRLTEDGVRCLDGFATDKDVERKLNALFDDVKSFLIKRGVSITVNQIQDGFFVFLRRYLEPIVEFFNLSLISSQPLIPKLTSFEEHLIEYLKIAEQKKPDHYRTLQDMVFGSIISTILNSERSSDLAEIRTKKFKHTQVFLDTNFIFYTLGLDIPEFEDPAKELFNLLKKCKFKIKAFSFTVEEICRVMNGYLGEEYRYPVSMRIADSLYSSLKIKGWKKSDAIEFISNIENTLANLGIEIEWVQDINLEDYNPKNDELRGLLLKYRPVQPLISQNHDLAAIEKIKQIRGRPERRIENSKAFFLTSDKRLSKFNFMEMGHARKGTVCESILDALLTNILWLKDPCAEVTLKSIIRAYSWDLFVKRGVWERFYDNLRELKKDGKVREDDISMLFYHNYIEKVLREFDEADVDKITPEFVLERIEEASKVKEQEVETRIREKEAEFFCRLEKEVSRKEQEKDAEWLEKLQEVKRNIRSSAERKANRYAALSALAITLLILVATFGIYSLCKELEISGFLNILCPMILGGSGIAGSWRFFRGYLKDKLVNHIYAHKLREARLDEIMAE